MCQGCNHFSGVLQHLVLTKLATRSIRVNPHTKKPIISVEPDVCVLNRCLYILCGVYEKIDLH